MAAELVDPSRMVGVFTKCDRTQHPEEVRRSNLANRHSYREVLTIVRLSGSSIVMKAPTVDPSKMVGMLFKTRARPMPRRTLIAKCKRALLSVNPLGPSSRKLAVALRS
jgi:Trk K+ transport system NAD-binding subunit